MTWFTYASTTISTNDSLFMSADAFLFTNASISLFASIDMFWYISIGASLSISIDVSPSASGNSVSLFLSTPFYVLWSTLIIPKFVFLLAYFLLFSFVVEMTIKT